MISQHDLQKAQANVAQWQERLKCYPSCCVSVNGFVFTMDLKPEVTLECTMPDELLAKILSREVHWNNAEIGGLIRFHRKPNVYMPDVHTLMSFFHV